MEISGNFRHRLEALSKGSKIGLKIASGGSMWWWWLCWCRVERLKRVIKRYNVDSL